MKEKIQNYSNHRHVVPLYHYLTFLALLVLLIGAVIMVANSGQLYAWMFLLLVLTVTSISFHCRSFVLKVQDRAIRAEENLRYFILTGKRLDSRLTIYQVIALRFAADNEFVELVDLAIAENLKANEIKKRIRNWRPDWHRA
jgi:hypothetical protein